MQSIIFSGARSLPLLVSTNCYEQKANRTKTLQGPFLAAEWNVHDDLAISFYDTAFFINCHSTGPMQPSKMRSKSFRRPESAEFHCSAHSSGGSKRSVDSANPRSIHERVAAKNSRKLIRNSLRPGKRDATVNLRFSNEEEQKSNVFRKVTVSTPGSHLVMLCTGKVYIFHDIRRPRKFEKIR